MIIKRIAELKQAGVWRDFSSPSDLQLAPRTLIYGFNGSGKTTLSRVFSSIQRGILEDRLPPETTFKIECSDSSLVTLQQLTNPFGKNLLVFNSDFILRNFGWDSLQKALGDADTELADAVKNEKYLTERELEIRNDLNDQGIGADKLNQLIWSYLGHKEIRLVERF